MKRNRRAPALPPRLTLSKETLARVGGAARPITDVITDLLSWLENPLSGCRR